MEIETILIVAKPLGDDIFFLCELEGMFYTDMRHLMVINACHIHNIINDWSDLTDVFDEWNLKEEDFISIDDFKKMYGYIDESEISEIQKYSGCEDIWFYKYFNLDVKGAKYHF